MSDPLLLKAMASLGAAMLLLPIVAMIFAPFVQAWLEKRDQ